MGPKTTRSCARPCDDLLETVPACHVTSVIIVLVHRLRRPGAWTVSLQAGIAGGAAPAPARRLASRGSHRRRARPADHQQVDPAPLASASLPAMESRAMSTTATGRMPARARRAPPPGSGAGLVELAVGAAGGAGTRTPKRAFASVEQDIADAEERVDRGLEEPSSGAGPARSCSWLLKGGGDWQTSSVASSTGGYLRRPAAAYQRRAGHLHVAGQKGMRTPRWPAPRSPGCGCGRGLSRGGSGHRARLTTRGRPSRLPSGQPTEVDGTVPQDADHGPELVSVESSSSARRSVRRALGELGLGAVDGDPAPDHLVIDRRHLRRRQRPSPDRPASRWAGSARAPSAASTTASGVAGAGRRPSGPLRWTKTSPRR